MTKRILGTAAVATIMASPLSSTTVQAMGRGQKQKPVLMGVMGDSISAGTLSDLPLQPCSADEPAAPSPSPVPSPSPSPDVSARLVYENKERLSWASGKSVLSHYRLLEHALKEAGDERPLEVANVSSPGDEASDLPGQARDLLEQLQNGSYDSLIYLTILIGSNDACAKKEPTPLTKMREKLLETFSILSTVKQKAPLRILLVGIPRIPDLGAPAIRRTHTPVLGLHCSVVRDRIFRHCPNLLRWKTAEAYHAAMDIVEDRNRMLRSITAEAKAAYPNLDIVYSNHLFDLEIPPSMLAIDCFHPSKRGQEAISTQTWLDQPWF